MKLMNLLFSIFRSAPIPIINRRDRDEIDDQELDEFLDMEEDLENED